MKITQEEVVDRQTVLHIELEEQDLTSYLDRGYRRVVQRAMIPGFRKGKAPRAIVERYLGRESLLQEAVDFMVPDATDRAIAAQNLEAAGRPDVELVDLEPVTLKATVALTPEVDLGTYRDLRVEEQSVEVNEDDTEGRIQELLKGAASWEPVERPVEQGDMVTMAVVGTVEDDTILDESDAVYVAEGDSAMPFPGFSENLTGVEVGVAKDFSLKIPDDHADPKLAGKEAQFKVTVSDVKERNLPELDDEFAKSAGDGYESLAALRQSVEEEFREQAEKAQVAQYQEATLDELIKAATVDLPPMLVEHEVEHMVSRRGQLVDRLNIRMDDYLRLTGKTEEQTHEEMRESALERLTRSYALSTLAEREELQVSADEIDDKIQDIVGSSDDQGESRGAQYLDSQEARSAISERLMMEKALDRLTAIARGEAPELSSDGQSSHEDDKDPEKGGESVDTQA